MHSMNAMQDIHLDHNATTPVAPEVLDAMLPFLGPRFGNPSSEHPKGREARAAVEAARAGVAALIGADPEEIVFTGGGTEASNLAIRGTLPASRPGIVTSMIEHPATEACCALLESRGHPVTRIRPGPEGIVDPAGFAAAIGPQTGLVTLIHSQNETGALQPVTEVAAVTRAAGALMHADAAQSLGKVPVDVAALGVDLLSIAGHKLYAPKGIGALYIRRGTTLRPVLVGAGQERGRRPGTENVPYIVALGAACALARREQADFARRAAELSARLLAQLREQVPGLILTCHPEKRLPNTLNLLFPGVSGRALLARCQRVMASTGSACHAASEEPSATLTAMGIARGAALGAVRLSLGRATTQSEIEAASADLIQAWRALAATPTGVQP